MDASAVASAEYWLSWIDVAKLVAAFLVATGVVIEFGTDWVVRPFEKTVNDARQAEMARLHKDAADAQLALERYRAPRMLSGEQMNAVRDRVKQFAPVEYALGVSTDDPEQTSLADLIGFALKSAGWTPVGWYRDMVKWAPGHVKIGKVAVPNDVVVSAGPSASHSDAAASALVDALKKAGLKTELASPPVLQTFPGIKIMIGKKS